MLALSVRQPWASLIIHGVPIFMPEPVPGEPGHTRLADTQKVWLKDIENRTWPLPRSFKLPQRIAIHAASRMSRDTFKTLADIGVPWGIALAYQSPLLPRGGLIGEVDVVECVTESASPWFEGPYGFVLRNRTVYPEIIPCRGRLGFFTPPTPVKA